MFTDLSLEINNNSNLKDCLNDYFKEEKLKDKFLCEKCNKKSRAKK